MTRKSTALCNPAIPDLSIDPGDGAEPTELRALTGLRVVAAFAVLLFHLRWYLIDILGPGAAPLVALLNAGYLGVDLFFLLSGFILAYRYGTSVNSFGSRSYLRFLAPRRFKWI